MGANIDTQTGDSRAAQARAQMAARAQSHVDRPELLDAPAGPPPAFEITQLQQTAARLRAGIYDSVQTPAMQAAEQIRTEARTEARSTRTTADGGTAETVTVTTVTVTGGTDGGAAASDTVERAEAEARLREVESRIADLETGSAAPVAASVAPSGGDTGSGAARAMAPAPDPAPARMTEQTASGSFAAVGASYAGPAAPAVPVVDVTR